MYTSFKIRNFRCFEELELDDLERVNLIAGMNNVGKTALLEAIYIHCGGYNPELALHVRAFRGFGNMEVKLESWTEHPLSSLFNQFDVSKVIELTGEDTVTTNRSLWLRVLGEPSEIKRGDLSAPGESVTSYIEDGAAGVLSSSEVAKVIEFEYEGSGKKKKFYMIMDRRGIRVDPTPPAPPFPTFLQGARMRTMFPKQAEFYGNLELYEKQDQVLQTLSIVEPRLKSIRSVAVAGGPILHGDIGIGRLIPLPIMGEGIVRLADVAVKIANAPNGVVLVDEIENGLHYSIMFKVWKAIALAARQSNTQIFATTHSWECVQAAHEAFASEETYDFRLHRLDRMNGEITAVTYDQESLDASLKHGLEVR